MERPYSGRALINETIQGLSIEIPAKRNWFAIIFLTAWLGGWLIGELFALGFLISGIIGKIGDSFGSLFILFWLIGWTVGGFFAIRSWLWMVAGKEILSFESNELRIEKKAALLYSPKIYDLTEVKNFALNPNTNSDNLFGMSSKDVWNLSNNGIFKFDYGLKTIKIANGLDEAEGRFILEKIKAKNLIK
jgi:hypothetical protein